MKLRDLRPILDDSFEIFGEIHDYPLPTQQWAGRM
jgi:hypothetical protein